MSHSIMRPTFDQATNLGCLPTEAVKLPATGYPTIAPETHIAHVVHAKQQQLDQNSC
jgi:hypothetical protein